MDDLTQYVLAHYRGLLTPNELEAAKVPPRPAAMSAAIRSATSEDLRLAAVRRQVVERILREHAADVVLNRCPRCDGLCRTPRARQCFRCNHSWHEPEPPPPPSVRDPQPSVAASPPMILPGMSADVNLYVGSVLERGGRLSLEEFVAQQQAVDLTEAVANAVPDLPHLSRRDLYLHTLFTGIADLEDEWLSRGVARRLTLDEPAELARFLGMNSRVKYLWHGGIVGNENEYGNVYDALRGLAVRDVDVALAFATTGTFPLRSGHRDTVLAYNGVYSVLRRESSYPRTFERALAGRKTTRWFGGLYEGLRGIMKADGSLVAQGLDQMLKARSPWHGPLEKVINLEAHGLYELARWVSPDLVSEFDTDRPLPWDRKLTEWTVRNKSPMRGVRLPGLPLALRKAILRLERPQWLVDDRPAD
jgi:hypothetical protein